MSEHYPLWKQYGFSYSMSTSMTLSSVHLERNGGICKLFPLSSNPLSNPNPDSLDSPPHFANSDFPS